MIKKSKLLFLMLSVFAILLISCETPPEDKKNANSKISIKETGDIKRDIEEMKNGVIRERGNLFYSKEFNEAEKIERDMKAKFAKGMIKQGNEVALKVLERYRNIARDVTEKKEKINYLKENIEKYLNDAEVNEAYIWIPLEIDEVNNLYFEATRKYKMYDIENSLGMYSKTFNKAQQTAKKAKEARALKETEERMYKQLKALEAASELPIYSNNKLIKPSPWNGRALLKDKSERINLLDSQGKPYLLGQMDALVLAYEEKAENIEKSDSNKFKTLQLIEKARQLWEQGLEAKSLNNLRLANELFLDSARYLKAYQSHSSKELYIVKIGNTLWGISKKLYNDPYLWPKIWFANRQKIQNPDLIHANWKIIIPSK
ncbi:Putative membrane associated protein [Borrelia nietonii YOR]|uniref:Membrane associated protein n=1 Tax=Borrelia nietonii YOR TaxID=1293576 RepID=A0ABN4C2J4_9SPIR|nr:MULTISPECIES: LysM peptidoglycan-binding domain-containing protein [Borrelia]AHH03300.1 Putative membrane associated protein [Borrelia nietonii YOR]AHH13826.1 Putative membrane associated protein [Borrelia hermsii MTW]UPA09038.1 LysM peptidoglycan-binding domain-containing protein [Borrelia nietonii YOR]